MISVIITTKNGGRFLGTSVPTVLAQENVEFELIIVSDGSTDDTVEVAKRLASGDAQNRIRVIELQKNIGPGLARNMAIQEARGEFIALIDDDDAWLSTEKLKNQRDYLMQNPDTVIVGASRIEFVRLRDAAGAEAKAVHDSWLDQEKDPEKIRKNMLAYNPVMTSSVMFRKDVFEKVGGFKEMRLAEDYDLWLRMGEFGKIANVDGADIAYTVRDMSASMTKQMEMAKVVLGLARQYKNKYPNYMKALLKAYARIALVALKKVLK